MAFYQAKKCIFTVCIMYAEFMEGVSVRAFMSSYALNLRTYRISFVGAICSFSSPRNVRCTFIGNKEKNFSVADYNNSKQHFTYSKYHSTIKFSNLF